MACHYAPVCGGGGGGGLKSVTRTTLTIVRLLVLSLSKGGCTRGAGLGMYSLEHKCPHPGSQFTKY